MTLLFRRATYIFFIAIFLIVSPLVILYTMGYRYNFTKGRVQKTGIIKVTSLPKGADIYLNGVKYETSQTPAKIEYVLPGDYEIKLAKDGYFDWQKKLAVYENGTTFAEKIMLWKKSDSQLLTASSAAQFLIAPDKNSFVSLAGSGAINLTDINSGLLGELSGGATGAIAEIKGYQQLSLESYSPSGRYLLISGLKNKQRDYFIADTVAKNSKKLAATGYERLKWDKQNDKLYAISGKKLMEFNLVSLQPTVALADFAADDFLIDSKDLYFIADQTLSKTSLTGGKAAPIKKVGCSQCLFKEIKLNKALVDDPSRKILTVVDLNGQLKNIELPADHISWLNGDSLLAYNDFEIYILELAKSDPELITRLGTPIKAAIWHPNGRHLVISTDNQIKIIELDNRELRNIISLKEAAADFLAVDRAGKNLYYAIDKAGIFKLNIQ